jgi:tRNA nucleotidyltransferase (CCA-adding enzyme)
MNYPKSLNKIFITFKKFHIKPIIVGGYVRDTLLKIDSKDIDVELYGVDKLQIVEDILKEFGEVNSVGKSFGVCKLKIENLEIDFSLPREDSKVSIGHKGFEITTDANLNFTTASSRRDFKMNAIGYDVVEKKILDPFDGQKDIKEKKISAIDELKFIEDPLRVLRAVQFAARFEFTLDEKLFILCKKMVANNLLNELPKERIFQEIKKLLLKSQKPSQGFILLKKLNTRLYFSEFKSQLPTLDFMAQKNLENKEEKLSLMVALLSLNFKEKEQLKFLYLITESKSRLKEVGNFIQAKKTFNENNFTDYDIYILATKVKVKSFLYLLDALFLGKREKEILGIEERAKKLGVLYKQIAPLILGRDLIQLGLKPSPKFSTLLKEAYNAQLKTKFRNKEEAIVWLKNYLY